MTEMYEELITNLRNCAETNSLSLYKRELMKQAADAVEELTRIVKEYQKFDGFLAAHGMFEPPKEETE